MYNEDVEELKSTLRGVLHNYNELRGDPTLEFKKEDFVVFLIVDGFDKLTDEFKKIATEKGFLDESVLRKKGFMERDKRNKKLWKMK